MAARRSSREQMVSVQRGRCSVSPVAQMEGGQGTGEAGVSRPAGLWRCMVGPRRLAGCRVPVPILPCDRGCPQPHSTLDGALTPPPEDPS